MNYAQNRKKFERVWNKIKATSGVPSMGDDDIYSALFLQINHDMSKSRANRIICMYHFCFLTTIIFSFINSLIKINNTSLIIQLL
jgi:hypothetical protein